MSVIEWLTLILSLIAIITTIYGVGVKMGDMQRTLRGLEEGGCKRLQNIDKSVTKLDTQMQPFWAIVEAQIAQSLHHDDTPEYDRLLVKLSNGINRSDLVKLRRMLEADLNHASQNGDQWRTLSIALVLTRVKLKLEADSEITKERV